ncbi:hypothetical protein OH492_10370 [Vibrio chagasii]|nr:hypothetical protein [Vibrio chagasii]
MYFVPTQDGSTVYLKDIARVELGKSSTTVMKVNTEVKMRRS